MIDLKVANQHRKLKGKSGSQDQPGTMEKVVDNHFKLMFPHYCEGYFKMGNKSNRGRHNSEGNRSIMHGIMRSICHQTTLDNNLSGISRRYTRDGNYRLTTLPAPVQAAHHMVQALIAKQ
ncbi:hypothetical protein X801_09679 [Opisthorchis viverrini]|uniref:Uncharacterized protein n=1 Tax=Opisthorchis viverrini TaxID=6198 RepID=A0A1S8WJA7_OPIVI|nr:hypothetical protein X801_09679 [Opisthorchis viverrini]